MNAWLVDRVLDDELDVFKTEALREGLLLEGSWGPKARCSFLRVPGGDLSLFASTLITQGKVTQTYKQQSGVFHVSCYPLVTNYNNHNKLIFSICKLRVISYKSM